MWSNRAIFLLLCALSLGALPRAAQAADKPGIITGKVTSTGEVPLSEMVVYLESGDGKYELVVPKETIKVSQKGAKFAPAIVIACVGQTVDFLNDEDRPIEHNVFSNAPPKKFDLGLYKPGEARSVLFDKPGAVFIYCSIHRHMDGVVYVAPTPFTSRVNEDGTYKIENVPQGTWAVKTWQRRRRFPELSVLTVVKPGETAATDLELRRK